MRCLSTSIVTLIYIAVCVLAVTSLTDDSDEWSRFLLAEQVQRRYSTPEGQISHQDDPGTDDDDDDDGAHTNQFTMPDDDDEDQDDDEVEVHTWLTNGTHSYRDHSALQAERTRFRKYVGKGKKCDHQHNGGYDNIRHANIDYTKIQNENFKEFKGKLIDQQNVVLGWTSMKINMYEGVQSDMTRIVWNAGEKDEFGKICLIPDMAGEEADSGGMFDGAVCVRPTDWKVSGLFNGGKHHPNSGYISVFHWLKGKNPVLDQFANNVFKCYNTRLKYFLMVDAQCLRNRGWLGRLGSWNKKKGVLEYRLLVATSADLKESWLAFLMAKDINKKDHFKDSKYYIETQNNKFAFNYKEGHSVVTLSLHDEGKTFYKAGKLCGDVDATSPPPARADSDTEKVKTYKERMEELEENTGTMLHVRGLSKDIKWDFNTKYPLRMISLHDEAGCHRHNTGFEKFCEAHHRLSGEEEKTYCDWERKYLAEIAADERIAAELKEQEEIEKAIMEEEGENEPGSNGKLMHSVNANSKYKAAGCTHTVSTSLALLVTVIYGYIWTW